MMAVSNSAAGRSKRNGAWPIEASQAQCREAVVAERDAVVVLESFDADHPEIDDEVAAVVEGHALQQPCRLVAGCRPR